MIGSFDLQNGDWQNLIYLTLLLMVMLGSLVSRSDLPLARALKFLGSWAGIALVCVILYSFRFDLEDFKNRILGEVNPSKPRVIEQGMMVLKASDEGVFYVDSMIDDKPIRFVIDQNLSDNLLNHVDAKKLIDVNKKLVLDSLYSDAGKDKWGSSVKVDRAVIGDVVIDNLQLIVGEEDAKYSRLGMAFFERFEKYNVQGGKIYLRNLKGAPSQVIVNSSDNSHYYMNVSFNGAEIRCLVDTGASRISLDATNMQKIGIDPSRLVFRNRVQTASGYSTAADVSISQMKIDNIVFNDITVFITNADMNGMCLLGMDFLQKFKRYEFSRGRLVLTM